MGLGHDRGMTDHRLDVIVLAGGQAQRLGGVSKADVELGGHRLLDIVLDAAHLLRGESAGCDVVVAAETVTVPASALRTMEEPPGSGPLAGIDAGLRLLPPSRPDDLVLVCAVDSPGIEQWAPQVCAALEGDGQVNMGRAETRYQVDVHDVDRGHCPAGAVAFGGTLQPYRQHLQGIYRRQFLETAIASTDAIVNQSVRSVLDTMDLVDVPVDPQACRDLDTPDDLAWWAREFSHCGGSFG